MKILVVRFRQIGDAILSTPICNSLRKTFPDAQIDYVVYEHIVPLFEKHRSMDNVIGISKEEQKNFLKYLKKVWKITRTRYDVVIDIMSTPKSEMFSLFSPRAKYRIGRRKKKRGYTYTHKIAEPKNAENKVVKFLHLLEPLEEEYDIRCDEDFSIEICEEELLYMREKMESAGVDFSKPIFAFAINSRVPAKVFNIQKMLEITRKIIDDLDPQIIFYYSPSEKEFVKKAHEKLGWDRHIFSNIETKSIRELAMLIKNCDMFFGNEGGPRHLSQALGVPTFIVQRPFLNIREWIVEDDLHQGVGALDVDRDAYQKYTYQEQEDLISVDLVIDKFMKFYEKYIKKEK